MSIYIGDLKKINIDIKMVSYPERFHKDLENLCNYIICVLSRDDVKEHMPYNPALLKLAFSYISSGGNEKLIKGFIDRSNTLWSKIREKDRDYFVENAVSLFGEDIPVDKLQPVLDILRREELVSDEDMDLIYRYLFSMIKVCIRHVHGNEDFEELDSCGLAEEWKIKL
jgi:hypothetical protein